MPRRNRKEASTRLDERQHRFVQEFVKDFNGTQAAIRSGYSRKSAGAQASTLLKNPKISAAINKAQAARAKRLDITVDRIEQEFAACGFSDMRELAEWGADGLKLKASSLVSEAAARAVVEVTEKRTGEVKIRLHNKLEALFALARRHGFFNQKGDGTGQAGEPVPAGEPWPTDVIGMEGKEPAEFAVMVAGIFDRQT